MKKRLWVLMSVVLTLVVVLGVTLVGCSDSESAESYRNRVNNFKVNDQKLFANDIEDSIPQTVVYKLLSDHFNAPLPEGKTKKKAIFLGYDGFRADALETIMNNKTSESAIMNVREKGGLYLTFSGGVSGVNEQATSTAPSWAALLTGGWGDYNGVTNNGQKKKADVDTILTEVAKKGYTASFTTSWREHTKLTYFDDIVNSIQNGYPVEYTHQVDDEATLYQVLKYVSKPNAEKETYDPDIVFFTFEHTDHAGHDHVFSQKTPEYVQATKDIDAFGMKILNSIYNRSTYAEEDWLIIIATDHGGNGKNHGGQSQQERVTWLATNKVIKNVAELKNYAKK